MAPSLSELHIAIVHLHVAPSTASRLPRLASRIPSPASIAGKTYVYADRGETMLKGFQDSVRLYEVRWRG